MFFAPFTFCCALFAQPWHGNSIKVTNCPNFWHGHTKKAKQNEMKIRLKEIQMNSQWTIANKETKSKTHMSKYPHAYSLSEVVCLCVCVCVYLFVCVFVWLGKICMFSVSDCGRGHSWIMSCNWSNSACSTCPAVSQEFSSAWISQQLEAVIRKAYKETQCLLSSSFPLVCNSPASVINSGRSADKAQPSVLGASAVCAISIED